jgi:hypothetical protein
LEYNPNTSPANAPTSTTYRTSLTVGFIRQAVVTQYGLSTKGFCAAR